LGNQTMSKPIEKMTKEELQYTLQDLLEYNHQMSDGYCPWCQAEEYPINEQGKPIENGSLAMVDSYAITHSEQCAVTLIENIFNGKYKYINGNF